MEDGTIKMKHRALIWSLPTRIFHWLLVLYILIMYITSDEDPLLRVHAAFGYGIGVLILFRVIWGFIGPKYSKFSDWPLSIKEALEFTKNIFNPKVYAGHNPAASFVMLGIIIVTLLSVITGVLAYGIQEGRGIFAFLNSSFFKEMEIFKEIHEALSTLLLILIGAHIGGVAVDRVLHKEVGTLHSIFTGFKNIDAKSVNLSSLQKVVATLFLSVAILTPIVTLSFATPLTKSIYKPIKYDKELSSFVEECASCHTLYPPFTLPAKSWKKLMAGLNNHFGDDASLDEATRVEIEKYLVKNSAEHSTKESAVYILQSLKNYPIAITQTPFWKKRHKDIDKQIFKSKEVKSKANCKACHKDIEKGIIEDRNIEIPKA